MLGKIVVGTDTEESDVPFVDPAKSNLVAEVSITVSIINLKMLEHSKWMKLMNRNRKWSTPLGLLGSRRSTAVSS